MDAFEPPPRDQFVLFPETWMDGGRRNRSAPPSAAPSREMTLSCVGPASQSAAPGRGYGAAAVATLGRERTAADRVQYPMAIDWAGAGRQTNTP